MYAAATAYDDRTRSLTAARVLAEAQVGIWRERLVTEAQREILAIHPGCPNLPTAAQERAALRRGVACKLLYSRGTLDDCGALQRADAMAEAGAATRTTDADVAEMLIADGTTAMVPLEYGENSSTWILVTDCPLLQALTLGFQSAWAKARTSPLSREDAQLVRLLASGIKDEAAARQLRVSSRTVLRRLDRFMQQAGARTRFQAGVLAAKNGWLD